VTLHHIAWFKRTPPDNHPGGVPLFGDYLRRVLGARLWSWSDYPNRGAVDEPEAARLLGEYLSVHLLCPDTDDDIVIADGFWARGILTDHHNFGRIITVAHGTWRGIARAFGSAQAARLGDIQAVEYARLPVVAVSESVAQELRDLYGVEPAAVIRNGVDTEEFRPREKAPRTRPVIIYPSDAKTKGGDIVAALRARRPDWEFRRIGAEIGAEAEAIAQGDVYLHPSRYEGCSYAVLEALACGLPVVGSGVGMLANGAPDQTRRDDSWGIVCAPGVSLQTWELSLEEVLARQREASLNAHAWAVEHGSLTRWEREWRSFLQGVPVYAGALRPRSA